MTTSESPKDTMESLAKTEDILRIVLATLGNLEPVLLKIERALSTTELPTSSCFVAGSTDGVVCIAGALIPGTQLAQATRASKGSGRKLPPLVLSSDSGESEETNIDILRTIKKNVRSPRYIVALRALDVSLPLKNEALVFIGTRYFHGGEEVVRKLEALIRDFGLEAVRDNGEFGGGALVFSLVEIFSRESELIIELAISREILADHDWFLEFLSLLAEI